MTVLEATVEGIGFWCNGVPSWEAACALLRSQEMLENPPTRPAPQLLAANERRRAPETVAVALEAALAACEAADRSPASLPSVFTSTHGDLAITDYMCATLAEDPRALSPTRFHNSVHNAAAGYWTIGAGALPPATAISALEASFAQGLLEAMTQLATGAEAVLLVAYDSPSCGPLAAISSSKGLLGGALVLSRAACPGLPRLRLQLSSEPQIAETAGDGTGALTELMADNAMRPMLPFFEALALDREQVQLSAGRDLWLHIGIRND